MSARNMANTLWAFAKMEYNPGEEFMQARCATLCCATLHSPCDLRCPALGTDATRSRVHARTHAWPGLARRPWRRSCCPS
jgi:hypothetical protein